MRPTALDRALAARVAQLPPRRAEVFSRDDGHIWAGWASPQPAALLWQLFRQLRRAGFHDVDFRLRG
ncbi:MAG: hypothetical protein OEO20_11395 [Gemmatimonadota bacterium]|nr:hypothetical protein [Gemmatimonadota bacterium]MDH3478898.1 hypothetical protein [Gemmatimonadota bacterium]